MSLNQLAWNDSCCSDGVQWIETQTSSGEWLRIKKPLLGGYLVTRFGTDKMLKAAEVEMSADEVTQELAR